MSKRDEDAGADLEVGMTTAERRRRRRRGGGLRVPSDNVPRTRTPTAPPAPVPEDPALAMSIAYSFTSDASGPVSRNLHDAAPIAPEAMSTVPDASQGEDFEMKTREMTAVDLEALGLSADAGTSMPGMSASRAIGGMPALAERPSSEVDVEVSVEPEAPEPVTTQLPSVDEPEPPKPRAGGQRHKTVVLSEEDLEEVRAATQEALGQHAKDVEAPQPVARPPDANRTMQLSAVDVEELSRPLRDSEPMSVPDIDIQELADRAESSGEIEVDVEAEGEAEAAEPEAPTRSSTPSVPPQIAAAAPAQKPRTSSAPPAPPTERKSGAIDAQASGAQPPATATQPPPPPPQPAAGAQPPPPPPKPPAPPKKPLPQAAVAAVVAKEPSRPTGRARPWFVDLFDEDYLRTLPFLTPQATQAEAEFVINAMNLAPGAQVLDLGCGYGRHAMELAARGYHVVGLDLSTPLLVRGGEEAHRRGLTINFVRGDMRELDFENQFDGVYCLFSTFGYFDDETNKKTLQNVARALKPHGKVLVEILNRDYVIADLPTRVWWEGDGCVVLEEVELNYFSSRIQVNRSVVFDDGRQLEQEISVRAYSLHEVGKLMHAAGFRVLEVSGGYQTRGRFFGNQSRHIIVLAERKETSGS